MPAQQPQRRVEPMRDSSASQGQASRSQSLSQPPVLSIETPERSLPPPSTSQTPRSPAPTPLFRIPQSPRSAVSDSALRAAKVAIPRLKRIIDADGGEAQRSGGRHRVNHACEPCRHRKTKCSGERPVCRHCQDFKITCFYADGKRDRVKKQFGTMTEKVADYEALLKDLMTRVSDADANTIRGLLEKETTYDAEDTATEGTLDSTPFHNLNGERDASPSGAESEASAGAGSTGALDRTDEDFTREQARATGFMGKSSEVTWLQRLQEENRQGENQREAYGDEIQLTSANISSDADPDFKVNESSYHLDDMSIFTYDAVDPYEMPTPGAANHLFAAYMERVHPSFPIVGRLNLTGQFRKLLSGTVQSPPDRWLAILNMIFAIGAKYSHLVNADWRGDERDHLIYFTRARLLSIDSEAIFQHPDLQQIQVLGLMSFYLLCVGQVNRSWILNGFAIRQANALAMNVRNDSANLKNSLKEIRYRVWWALYVLEHRLCNMTGRVNCVLDEHCTTPLPIPLEEEGFETEEGQKLLSKESQQGDRAPSSNPQTPIIISSTPSTDRSRSQTKIASRSPSIPTSSNDLEWAKDVPPNSSLYFLHLVQLNRLTQAIFHRLYNPAAISGTWTTVQTTIKELDEQLEYWYRKLPQSFAFRRKQRERTSYEYRLNLGFCYYSSKMTIHRPCLCRLDRKIPNQSSKSLDFNRNSATTCVEAALEMLTLIPDEPNAVGLLRVGPWWSILHWLVQATTVLMLEISFRANHMPEETETILESSKKGIRWLYALAEDNPSAKRAWTICYPMLREAVKKVGRDVEDLPWHPPGKAAPPLQDGHAPAMSGSNYQYPGNLYTSAPGLGSTYGTMAQIPTSQAFSLYDPMMQYDQYFPTNFQVNDHMQYEHHTDGDTTFMNNAYHDEQGYQPGGDGHQ